MADSLLISEIRKRPHLYDPKNVDFRDVPKREEAWLEISKLLTLAGKTLYTVDDVQNRWKVLRDRYVREKRGRSNGQAPSRKDPWPLVETLKFLDRYVIHRKSMMPFTAQHNKSVSETVRRWSASFNLRPQPPLSEKGRALSMEEDEEEEEDEPPSALVEACLVEESDNIASPSNSVTTTESSDVPTAKPKESKKTKDSEHSAPNDALVLFSKDISHRSSDVPSAKPKESKKTKDSEHSAPNDALVHFSKDVSHSKLKKTDEEELFCLSIAPALRRLPHQKKAFAKLKIMELLYNYEFCDEPF